MRWLISPDVLLPMLVLVSAFCVMVSARCFGLARLLDKSEDVLRSTQDMCRSLAQEVHDADRRSVMYYICMLITYMDMADLADDRTRKVMLRHQLYFMGVPQDVIDDRGRHAGFIQDCLDDKYNILEGEPPYKWKFVKRNSDG